ncbi:MAG: IS1 family transposase, partial [Tepidiformaceae bacterium]
LFLDSVAQRLSHRVQLTTDGYGVYLDAVAGAFRFDVDFAQLIKKYGEGANPEKRYSPSIFTGTETRIIRGDPNPEHISTSYVERQNLTMRMSMRRFTRLTNGFSKKAENLAYAVALHFEYYNFCRPHQTLKGRTPAMAAGVTDRVWSIDDLIDLLEAAAADLHTKSN